MKKVLSGIVAIVVLLFVATSSVNAASVVADKTEVNKGDKVVVSVNLEQESRNIDVKLNYDSSKFEYVSDSATSSLGSLTVNDKNPGKIIVSGSNASQSTKQVSFTFVAKENTDAATFTASGLVTESDEELTNDSVSVKVVEKAEEATTPSKEEPAKQDVNNENDKTAKNTETAKATNNAKTETKKAEKVDTNGKKITKLPQTGVPYIVIGSIALIAVISSIIIKRNNNN